MPAGRLGRRAFPSLTGRRMRRHRPSTLTLAAAAIAVAATTVLAAPGAASGATAATAGAIGGATAGDPSTVVTSTGAVHGTVTADGPRFYGIPYAAPPTGDLRFAPPRPAAPWAGVRDATAPPPSCAQSTALATEDCLVVNVYVPPDAGHRRLPVMVWLHGGAYTVGSAAGYDPTPLVTRGDVIVVGVNYRLGP